MSKKQVEAHQYQEVNYISSVSLICDITLILGEPPDINEENYNHFSWYDPDVFVCHGEQIIKVKSIALSREEFLALAGVASVYDYKLTDMLFGKDKDPNFNPFEAAANKH